MEYVLTPKACKESQAADGSPVPPRFSGTVTIRLPRFKERAQVMEKLALEGKAVISAPSADDAEKTPEQSVAELKVLAEMIGVCEPFVTKVEIQRAKDGKAYTSFEDLDSSLECASILMDIVHVVTQGPDEGND